MTWTIQYLNGSTWTTIPNAVLDQIIDELNGQLELDLIIPNTPSNLTFVQSDQQIQILWGSTSVFSGLLQAYTATFSTLTCTVYNNTFEIMKKRSVTGQFNNVAANTVFAAICAACGMTAGSCPSTVISTQFNATDCFTAAGNLANILGLNLYNVGTTVNIGVKGNQTPTALIIDTQSNVNIDRSKSGYDGVIVRSTDQAGNSITGSAGNTGPGYNVQVVTSKTAMSQASLNSLATYYLQSLQETNSGCPLECDISQSATLNSGDLVTITNGAGLGLSGNYAIYRITKNLTKSTVEIVRPQGIFINLIGASTSIASVLGSMADSTTALATLPVGSDQIQGGSISVQQLIGLFHVDEGQGTTAEDSSSLENNGLIGAGCTWIQGPVTKVLMFNGNGSYIDIPNNSIDFSGLSAMAFTAWFSPTVAAAQYLAYKANQFYVLLNVDGSLTFGLYIGSAWVTLNAPAGSASVSGRNFGAFVYDGTNMYIYVDGPLVAEQAQTGTIGSSTSDTYLGAENTTTGGFTGVLAEVWFYARSISADEVYSLNVFPLLFLVLPPSSSIYRPNIQTKTPPYEPTTTYLESVAILPDGTIVAAPTGNVVCYEAGYALLALMAKNASGVMTIVEKSLDAYVTLQNSDGSWYQQYNAVINSSGTHDRVAMVDATHTGDLKVDSGCALLINAMATWDKANSQTRYETAVQKGLAWLHTLQYAHLVADGNTMIANEIYQGTTDTVAFSADTAECLLAMQAALNAYGSGLTGSDSYSVKTLANDTFYALIGFAYRGDAVRAYATTNPIGTNTTIPFDYKENISYAQALCALAVFKWSSDANNTVGSYATQAVNVIEQAEGLTHGQWGGQLYVPYLGNSDENQNEYAGYTAFMYIAMKTINATAYAAILTEYKNFIYDMCMSDGKVYDQCDKYGVMYISILSAPGAALVEGYGFLTLAAALALLADNT
jgi:hypothetical protein